MIPLVLHKFHHELNARFAALNGAEVVNDYGDWIAEHRALTHSVGIIDLSFRSRLSLLGADRVRFLHGQATNDIKRLRPGEGCYAALVTAKGKMQSDLNVYCLPDELLLEFEPGFAAAVTQRLEKFLVADDVQIVDVSGPYGLLSVQGPAAAKAIRSLDIFTETPLEPFRFGKVVDGTVGEMYLMNQPRLGSAGFDLFVPADSLGAVLDKLIAAAKQAGGSVCGWQALEAARIEAGIPRFGIDMNESHLPQECGIAGRAVSYNKGCYIGQEVLNRIHSMGHVNRELRKLKLESGPLPATGDKLVLGEKEVGHVTSATHSPASNQNLALGYVRREAGEAGTVLTAQTTGGNVPATIQ